MIARSPSWSAPRSDARTTVAAATVGVVLFLGCFALLHAGPLGRDQLIDTPTYQRYGEAMLSGRVPYRDFAVEYPPAALPTFLVPALAPAADYRTVFELEMALCGAAMVIAVAAALAAAGASPRHLYGASAFVGLAPLALGSVVLTRYDLWPAALTAAAVAALVSGRDRLGASALGLAIAAKVFAVVLLPVALLWTWRRRGGRAAAACLGLAVLVLGATLVPFGIVAPDGLVDALERQVGRPLQIESLGGAALLVAHQLGVYEPTVVSSFGSQNVVGGLPDALAAALSVLQALAVVGAWVLYAFARRGAQPLLAALAAALAAFVAFGKVLSPQYLLWLVPLVPLVAGGFGLLASSLLLVAMVLTHLWFPASYWDLVDLAGAPAWLALGRDVVLVALVAVLLVAIGRLGGRPRSA